MALSRHFYLCNARPWFCSENDIFRIDLNCSFGLYFDLGYDEFFVLHEYFGSQE